MNYFNKECPKCKSEMSQGKLIGNHLNWEKDGEQKFLKNDESNIVTFVCKKCGYLESYVK